MGDGGGDQRQRISGPDPSLSADQAYKLSAGYASVLMRCFILPTDKEELGITCASALLILL
jgi:hypothetical protein